MYIKKKLGAGIAIAVLATNMLLVSSAFAQTGKETINDNPDPFARGAGYVKKTSTAAGIQANKSLPDIIGGIINIFLGFLGVIFLCLSLYAGYLYMTAGGEEENIEKAKDA